MVIFFIPAFIFTGKVTEAHLAAGKEPGVSVLFFNRWHMYAVAVVNSLNFGIFLLLLVVPYLDSKPSGSATVVKYRNVKN